MTTKRKRERENDTELKVKRQRHRKRSRSEPVLLHDPIHAEKRQVLKRLFGRNCNSTFETEASTSAPEVSSERVEPETFTDPENIKHEKPPASEKPCDEEEHFGPEFQDFYFEIEYENQDPLLDSVPVDLDPEQLGFLVCAQETLRFLNGRGLPFEHPVFTRLRSRLLRGIDELAVA
ncbi:uncharacterized protein insb [Epargyreus clarus]|uniref:uncharacterized protein insb n=1 Tax=Epargyreus clarus TaxID=520877 RepID=UPI003C2AC83C